jgi:hypothetical protein
VGDAVLQANIELANKVDDQLEELCSDTVGFNQIKDNPTNCTDLFMCSIDSPPANSVIEVSISLFHDLFLTGDVFTLVLPTNFVPRFYAHEEIGKKAISKISK